MRWWPRRSTEDYRIAKLRLEPDDVLVVKVIGGMTMESMQRAKTHFDKLFPGTEILVIDSGTDLSVISRKQAPAPDPHRRAG